MLSQISSFLTWFLLSCLVENKTGIIKVHPMYSLQSTYFLFPVRMFPRQREQDGCRPCLDRRRGQGTLHKAFTFPYSAPSREASCVPNVRSLCQEHLIATVERYPDNIMHMSCRHDQPPSSHLSTPEEMDAKKENGPSSYKFHPNFTPLCSAVLGLGLKPFSLLRRTGEAWLVIRRCSSHLAHHASCRSGSKLVVRPMWTLKLEQLWHGWLWLVD